VQTLSFHEKEFKLHGKKVGKTGSFNAATRLKQSIYCFHTGSEDELEEGLKKEGMEGGGNRNPHRGSVFEIFSISVEDKVARRARNNWKR